MFKKVLEKIFKAPALALDEGIKVSEEFKNQMVNNKPFKKAEEYWKPLGPGFTTGAADDDPSGIATY